MKAIAKIFVVLLALVMIVTGCGKPAESATPSNSSTPGATITDEDISTPTATDNKATADTEMNTATATATSTATSAVTTTATATPKPTATPENIVMVSKLPEESSTFDKVTKVSQTKWEIFNSGELSISKDGYKGNCLLYTRTKDVNYHSPCIDLAPFIKEAGMYTVTFVYTVTGSDGEAPPFAGVIRTDGETSFSTVKSNGTSYKSFSYAEQVDDGDWGEYEATFSVKSSDIGKGGKWRFCLHMIQEGLEEIYIDNFELAEYTEAIEPVKITSATTWTMNEAVFVSDKFYDDPYNEVVLDLILTDGKTTYTIPAFWDGSKCWRARFMCPTTGNWSYTTKCSDTSNTGLHNQKSSFTCTKYSGDLDIYKHGWVKVDIGTKYFMYDDGTPFFYLGDTHWNLGSETIDIVKAVVNKRTEQSFTVIQSEPLGASFSFENGISGDDIIGLKANDEKFKYIADNGFVHVNASFFYPSSMETLIQNFGGYSEKAMGDGSHSTGSHPLYDLSDSAKAAIEKACRYWVARYSAFPVMWSLGQEVDNDFFWNRDNFNGHENWGYVNNPYRYVADCISKYDPYKSPLTAHQEGASSVNASKSAFRDVASHNFYGSQWSPSLTGSSLEPIAKDYWVNGQGKPSIIYEGRYCYLWTKNFGARAQGWMAYLSGMYGYGYGAQDTWSYLNTYNESETSNDGVDTITPEDKKNATWQDSLEYPSAYQVGYMRTFFTKTVGDWYNLIPRFDDKAYLTRESNAFAVVASNKDNTKIVAYFYNFSDNTVGQKPNSPNGGTKTGTFGNLTPNATYKYMWFDPINGKVEKEGTFVASASGKWASGAKKTTDMVLYIYK